MDWASIIVYIILIFFAIAIIARISGQTLGELLGGITEWIQGIKEDSVDRAIEI